MTSCGVVSMLSLFVSVAFARSLLFGCLRRIQYSPMKIMPMIVKPPKTPPITAPILRDLISGSLKEDDELSSRVAKSLEAGVALAC